MVTRMAAKVDTSAMLLVVIMKAILLLAPSNILPRLWTSRPHLAYGLGLAVGVILQNIVRPRLKLWQLCIVLTLAIVAALIVARL